MDFVILITLAKPVVYAIKNAMILIFNRIKSYKAGTIFIYFHIALVPGQRKLTSFL